MLIRFITLSIRFEIRVKGSFMAKITIMDMDWRKLVSKPTSILAPSDCLERFAGDNKSVCGWLVATSKYGVRGQGLGAQWQLSLMRFEPCGRLHRLF